jgi:hypothetical protein
MLISFLLVMGGCGGGGTTSNTGSLTCGPTFKTPNYVLAIDPANSEPNDIRFWPSFPISIHFENSQNFDDNGSTVSTTDLTRTAMSRWVGAADNAPLFTETGSPNGAKVKISFNQLASPPGSGGTLGRTLVSFFPSNNELVTAEIVINTWPGMTRAQFLDGLTQTITHELGHALYLQGHSDVQADTMYFQSDPSADAPLTTRDINSFQTAYCGKFSNNLQSRSPRNEQPVSVLITCPR